MLLVMPFFFQCLFPTRRMTDFFAVVLRAFAFSKINIFFCRFFFSFLIIHFVVGILNLCVHFSFKYFLNFSLTFNGVAHLTHSWLDAILVRDACMSLLIAIVAEMDVSNCCCGWLVVAEPRNSLFIDSEITICNSGKHKNYMSFKE